MLGVGINLWTSSLYGGFADDTLVLLDKTIDVDSTEGEVVGSYVMRVGGNIVAHTDVINSILIDTISSPNVFKIVGNELQAGSAFAAEGLTVGQVIDITTTATETGGELTVIQRSNIIILTDATINLFLETQAGLIMQSQAGLNLETQGA